MKKTSEPHNNGVNDKNIFNEETPKTTTRRSTKNLKGETEEEKSSSLSASDENMIRIFDTDQNKDLLSQVKSQWILGQWKAIAALDIDNYKNHDERANLALLQCSALLQLNQIAEAKNCAKHSIEWGCQVRLVARVLISGIYNSLGRIAALNQNRENSRNYFQLAVLNESKREKLEGHIRSIRELSKLGLLPQIAQFIDEEMQDMSHSKELQAQQNKKTQILSTEIELLRYELALAQQRKQIYIDDKTTKYRDVDWLEELKSQSVSQFGQDLWALEKCDYKRNGFFVEFGATDGIILSNTWLLEKMFGWDGICAEPNPRLFMHLEKNRSCTLSPDCISSKTGDQVEFILGDAYGGIKDYASQDDHAEKRIAYSLIPENVISLTTISLDDFLTKHNSPKNIDYMSIDTEGSEYEILKNFSFSSWNVKLFTIEHNFTSNREKIFDLMTKNGYLRIESDCDDFYYKGDK